MKIFSWKELVNSNKSYFEEGSALTIGSFDGPHKGHESLFVSVLKEAAAGGYVPGIVTFTQALPGLKHPENYPGDIATLQQRISEYERRGFEFALVIDFDEAFCRIEGGTFFRILMEKLNLKCIVEGVDFRCGYGGDFNMEKITAFGLENGLQTVFLNLVQAEGERISSSIIRKLVMKGDFSVADRLLERDFALQVSGIDEIDQKKFFLSFNRSRLTQVSPLSGEYSAVLNGSIPVLVSAFCDRLVLSPEGSDLNKSKTFNKMKEVCCTKPFVINFPQPGD